MTKLLVIGEICIDEYIYGTCDRVCPEAAAMCFRRSPEPIKQNYGMAGNVFENIKSIDPSANISLLSNNKSIQPIVKRRFVDLKYNTIVFREDINDRTQRIKLDNHNLDQYDIVIISDYNKGYLDYEDYKTIRKVAKNAKIFADTKKQINNTILDSIDILKINYKEYNENIGIIQNTSNTNCCLIITNGDKGALLIHNKEKTEFPISPIDIRDVCGAGDTFLAGLVVEYSKTLDIESSIRYANLVAGKVVQKFGVSVP